MKILILSFYYEPDLCAGSFRTTALVDEFKKLHGVELEIVTTLPNRYATFSAKAEKSEIIKNVSVHRIELPSHKSGMLDQIKAFLSYYKESMKLIKNKEYDLIYATSSRLFTAFLGARVASSKKTPLYLDIRDIFVDTIGDVLNKRISWLVKPIFSFFEHYTFSRASHINLVSQGFQSYFIKRFPNAKYSFFTNGIDNQFLAQNEKPKKDNEKISILYAGNIGEGQGLHTIIPPLSAKLGHKYDIIVVGDGGRKKQLIDACDGLDNVTILNPVNRSELLCKYQDTDILFLHLNDYPAFKKVLPSKIFEYAATGKPVLAGVSGYAAKFIQDEVQNAAVFSPNNTDECLSGLAKLNISTTDRTRFINKYTRKNIMKKMVNNIYEYGKHRA